MTRAVQVVLGQAPKIIPTPPSLLNAGRTMVGSGSAGTAGVDTLTNFADRALLVRFLQTIDASTPIFP